MRGALWDSGSHGPMGHISMAETPESHSAFLLLKFGGWGFHNLLLKEDFSLKRQFSWLQEYIIDLRTSVPSSILEANTLSLMDERGFRTNEFHEFFQPYVAICLFQGTWKKGNFTVPSLCNGAVLEKREKPWPLLGTSEPLAGLMGRGQARSKEVWVCPCQLVSVMWLTNSQVGK